MNRLLTDRINDHSPYDVEYDDNLLVFTTEHGLTYAVDFDDDANPYFTAYWLNLRNVYGQPSPGDKYEEVYFDGLSRHYDCSECKCSERAEE